MIIGANSVVLPGVRIGTGCAIGAHSLVKQDLAEWGVYAGVPVRLLKPRKRSPLEMCKKVRELNHGTP